MGDGEDNDIAGNNAVIRPEVAASQSVKGWMKSNHFFDAFLAKR
jgi:hypothetical protein